MMHHVSHTVHYWPHPRRSHHAGRCVVASDAFRTLMPAPVSTLKQCFVAVPVVWRHLRSLCPWMKSSRTCCFERSYNVRTPVTGDFDYRVDWNMTHRSHYSRLFLKIWFTILLYFYFISLILIFRSHLKAVNALQSSRVIHLLKQIFT